MASVTPEDTEDGELDNFDRLRTHLSADGLAVHLLDCWLADPAKDTAQLYSDLEAFYDSRGASVAATHQED